MKSESKKKMELKGEFRKVRPSTFYEEKEEDGEAWLLNMTNYFSSVCVWEKFKREIGHLPTPREIFSLVGRGQNSTYFGGEDSILGGIPKIVQLLISKWMILWW